MSELDSRLSAAQLQVVQPGTRSSFRRRVLDAMRSVLPAPCPGAFFCFGTQDARAYHDASRLVDGAAVALTGDRATRLTVAFGFEVRGVVTTTRRAYLAEELYSDAERQSLPYFRDNSVPAGFSRALLVFLHEGGVLFGVAGLERREADAPFTAEDASRVEALTPFIVSGARAQLAYDDLTREAAALRALGKVSGALYVVDRDRRTVLWATDRQHGIQWDEDVVPNEPAIVSAAEQLLQARTRGEPVPTPPRLPLGSVVAVAKLDPDPVFSNVRAAVVRVEAPQEGQPQVMDGLSRREREIARLLVAGYSGVNVAAIAGLSENTVRTYVRRLYAKLEVSNRADLVRKLVAPDPAASSSSPPSQIAPPPDSSLVDGDETLD